MSILDGFEVVGRVPEIERRTSRYGAIIDEFMASGSACMVREFATNGEARKLACGINQHHRAKSHAGRDPETGEWQRMSPWPGFKSFQRGCKVYLVNENAAGGDKE